MRKVLKNCLYMYKKIWKYSKLRIIFSLLLSFISLINVLVVIFFDKFVIDAIIEEEKNFNYFLILIGIRLGMLLILQLAENIFYVVIFPKFEVNIKKGFVTELYEKIKIIDAIDFDDSIFYDSYIRALNEADKRAIDMLNTLSAFVTNILQIAVLALTLAYFSPFIVIIAILGMLVTIWANVINNKKGYQYDMAETRTLRHFDYIKRIFYMPQYVKDVKITDISKLLLKKYNEQVLNFKKIISKYAPPIAAVAIAGSWLFNLVTVGISGIFIIYRIFKELMTIGDFVSVNHAVFTLSGRLLETTNLIPELTKHSLYIDNYLKIINYESKMIENKNAVIINQEEPHDLSIKGVSFTYLHHDKPVLDNINLEIKAGEHIALVGENGAGKTTLIKLIARLYDPLTGELGIDDIPYTNVDKNSLYKSFSLVQQDFQTYSISIKENIILSDISEKDNDKAIEKVLDTVGLLEKISEFQNGINSVLTGELDEEGINLSIGQLQRLAIARALFQDTSIIIMDEPSSSLDPITEAKIFEIINKICINKTLILISHRLSSVKNMDRIIFLEEGKILEQGTHKELMKLNKKYAEMFKTQAKNYIEN